MLTTQKGRLWKLWTKGNYRIVARAWKEYKEETISIWRIRHGEKEQGLKDK
jgi:hypothetical protein